MKKLSKKLLSVLLVIAMLVPTGAMTVPANAETEIEGIVEFNGHYYMVFNESLTWYEAKDACEELGGHLITVNTAEENIFITNILKTSAEKYCYWTAIKYDYDLQSWIHYDGSSIEKYNWADNEPNDWEKMNEAFVHIYGKRFTGGIGIKEIGEWNDVRADGAAYAATIYALSQFGYICEWESEGDLSGEQVVSGILTGASSEPRISIDGTWYEYDTSVPGLKEAIESFAINGRISCQIKNGKIIACSEYEIANKVSLSVNTSDHIIQYDSETKKYTPKRIELNINVTNNIVSSYGKTNMQYVAGYDVTFDKLKINIYDKSMLVNAETLLYFKDGWFGLGETEEIEKKFDSPVTLKAGETFNFSDDLTAFVNDDYKWGDNELKKENVIHVYAYNSDALVASGSLTVTFNNKTAETTVKNNTKLNEKIQKAASLLEKTTGVIYSPYLEELLTKDGLTEATNALKCKVALSSTILKAKKNETLEDKLIDKLMKKAGISKEWMGTVYTSDIIHSVSANTKEHGKFEVEFNIKLTNVSIGTGNPYAGFSFETTYKIKGGKNIKERTGSVTSYFGYADIQTFADSVEEVALEQIEYAYDLGYGDDINEVCEMFFDDTITSILSKTKAESYSHIFYESMIYPSKQMNIHCPVDIYIYNAEGVLCASVENNEVTMTCEDIDIEVIGDEKYLTIYDGDYSVEIIATAIDDMDVEIKEYSSKDKLFRTATFNDIALYPGDSFMTTVDENYLDSKYELIKNEEDVIVPDNDESSIHYLDEIKIIDKEATCTEDGKYHIECKECKETVLTEIIPATGHNDENHDGICDNCSEDFTKTCDCMGHSNEFMQFLHKILCFLYRIFGMEQYRYCGCGKAHW